MPIFKATLRRPRGSLSHGSSRSVRTRPRTQAGRALVRCLAVAGIAACALAAGPLGFVPAAQAQVQTPQPAPQGQSAAPQDPSLSGQAFGDWTQRCTPTPPPGASPPAAGQQAVCFIMQQVIDNNTQRPMLKITIGFFGPQRQTGAVIAMPLGVPLARGLHVSVDGQEITTVPFQVCRRDGCTAFMPLEPATIGLFKAGNQVVAAVDNGQGEGLDLPISLKGFTAGYDSIQ